jgi:methylated-DNA-[protein]-cysteine S-methyltransferase
MGGNLNPQVIEGTVFDTPFGWCGVAVSQGGVKNILLPLQDREGALMALKRLGVFPVETLKEVPSAPHLLQAVSVIRAYFRGEIPLFDFPLDLSSVSPFDRRVLEATKKIPYRETRTYGELARALGAPRAARAVGAALGRNPVPLAIP